MNIKQIIKVVLLSSTAILLTACEPTDTDVKNALNKEIEVANQGMAALVGQKAAEQNSIKLISSKKLGCKESKDNPGYSCDVDVEMEYPLLGKQKKTESFRFTKVDDGWKAFPNK